MNHRKESKPAGRRKLDKPASKKKPLIYGIICLALIAGIAVTASTLLGGSTKLPSGSALQVTKLPPKNADGFSITINNDEQDKPLCVTPYSEDASVANTAKCEVKPVLTIPVQGSCPIGDDGVTIGAPSDWTLACRHDFKLKNGEEGGVAFLGHTVGGSPVGALENIGRLNPGDIVKVGGINYKVALVSKFPAETLPARLALPNHISLITCYNPGDIPPGHTTERVVVELQDA
jgi:hypothetical protein